MSDLNDRERMEQWINNLPREGATVMVDDKKMTLKGMSNEDIKMCRDMAEKAFATDSCPVTLTELREVIEAQIELLRSVSDALPSIVASLSSSIEGQNAKLGKLVERIDAKEETNE